MREIQQLSLDIKRYTSGGTDRYRDWDIEAYFPNASASMNDWANILITEHDRLLEVAKIDEPSEISNMRVAAARLRDIAKDVNKLPGRMVQFSDGDSSINQILGNMMQRLMRSNMELERLMIHGDVRLPRPYVNIFVSFFEGAKRLILSFINNPYSASVRRDNEIMVWVNHPRQYIEIMQTMIDQQYQGEMKITLSQMPDQNKLILANASGQSPDIAIGVNHWIPYEFAIRSAALDLRQFEGYADLVSNFTKGAMIPYVFEQGVFGLPATQNFWVTYYRKDILESIGISEENIPQTWEEIIAILPLLQSYGMNYFVPLAQFSGLKPFVATLPFIYQFGGDLYTPDGMQTNINSEQTLEGIKLMSELFTLYNMPKFVASFYNHFRYGLLPIGISDLSTYLLLQTAAVELDGLWGMTLHPGVLNEQTGEIVRYAAVGGQANMILSATKYKDQSWDFLRWWMSTEVQAEFAFLLQSTYGKAYFWNTANVNAFRQIPMPSQYKEIILEQWEFGLEASRIPGNYMVEREISNAWTKIVFEGTNPRQALDEAVRISNREILYKMAEFGYTKNGVILKEYIVPSIYNIDDWLTEVPRD
jgi:ABC-type glycerol-3-phosphate transport system substrate-binding protein